MILVRELLTTLVLDLNFYERVTFGGDRPFEWWLTHMIDTRNYDFKSLTDKKLNGKNYFINF